MVHQLGARNRSVGFFNYEHEHDFIEHALTEKLLAISESRKILFGKALAKPPFQIKRSETDLKQCDSREPAIGV